MAHLIAADSIEKLATLSGVVRLDDWKEQIENAEDRIRAQLSGSVSDAWQACLPSWLEVGRVDDCSRAVRTPHYWQSYASMLGRAFAEVFRKDHKFLVDMLSDMPVESHEYLCACDLLQLIAFDLGFDDRSAFEEICGLPYPIPSVLRRELEHDGRNGHATSVGDVIRQRWLDEYGEDAKRPR
jgi:hypothetical protein